MNLLYLVFLSVLQGVTELFPVSSLGHTILLPALLGMPLDAQAPQLIPFLVTLHLGTAFALMWVFRTRWQALLGGGLASLRGRPNPEGKLLGLVLLGTVPTGLIGLALQHPLERVFHDLRLVAIFLILNGGVLWLGEILRRRARHAGSGFETLEALTPRAALIIGAAQILALIPGFSRSGLTLAAGLSGGLSRAAAAEFAFLLGTPIILAAGVLELPKLLRFHDQLAFALLGGLLTGGAAYLSVRFLMRYFTEGQRMYPFALYCAGAGALSLALLLTRG